MVVLRRRLQAFYDYEEDDLREIVSAIIANRIIENTIRRRSVRVRVRGSFRHSFFQMLPLKRKNK